MGNSYPGLRRPETFRGPPVAANDNVKTPMGPYGGYGKPPPMRLKPANDNQSRRARMQIRGMAKTLAASPIHDILWDAVHVASSRFTPPEEEWDSELPVPAAPAGWFWSRWNRVYSQCAVPASFVMSGLVTNNCSAPANPTVPSQTPTYGTNATQEFWTWVADRHEFINPTAGWRMRQKLDWRLVHQRPPTLGVNGWPQAYPDGPPFIVTTPGFNSPLVLPRPFPRPQPAPWVKPQPDYPADPWEGPSKGPAPQLRPEFPPQIIIVPGAPPVVGGRPTTPSRPPKGTKEIKSKLGIGGSLGGGLLGLATESVDVIEAIHDALAPECRAKPKWHPGDRPGFGKVRPQEGRRGRKGYWTKPSPIDMANAVYNNFDCLDIGQMWSNLMDETLEDMTFGMASDVLREGPLGGLHGPIGGPMVGPAL